MRQRGNPRAFTLIELLVVIAIIAILAALLFPVMGQVKESARATDCLSKLHQLWVSANVFRQDEGTYPPSLMGYAEHGLQVPVDGNHPDGCDKTRSTGSPFGSDPNNPCIASADRIINGFLYSEQIKDNVTFKCADNPTNKKAPINAKDAVDVASVITVAYFPPRPPNWPTGQSYITDNGTAVQQNCPKNNTLGYVDCFLSGPLKGKPKFYYTWDSYAIGPRISAAGSGVISAGNRVYDVHYSPDWTGVTGATDLPDQLKYENPPGDKTLLTFCSWHAAVNHAPTFTSITMSGQAKKVDLNQFLKFGADVYYR